MSGRDTWIATAISTLLGICWFLFLITKSSFRFIEIIKTPLGKIISIILLFYLIEAAILMIYDFKNFFTTIMPLTPPELFSIVLIFLCVYTISLGFENTAYISTLLIAFSSLFIIFGIGAGISRLDIKNVLPVLDSGFYPVVKGYLFQFSNIGHLLVLYLLPLNLSSKQNIRSIIFAYVIIYLIIFTLSITLIAAQGTEQTTRTTYMFFQLFRLVTIGNFLRVDSFFIPLWFATFLIKVSVLLFAIVKLMQVTFNLKDNKILLLPTAVILVSLTSMSFSSYLDYMDFYINTNTSYSIFVQLFVPLSLLVSGKIAESSSKNRMGGDRP